MASELTSVLGRPLGSGLGDALLAVLQARLNSCTLISGLSLLCLLPFLTSTPTSGHLLAIWPGPSAVEASRSTRGHALWRRKAGDLLGDDQMSLAQPSSLSCSRKQQISLSTSFPPFLAGAGSVLRKPWEQQRWGVAAASSPFSLTLTAQLKGQLVLRTETGNI